MTVKLPEVLELPSVKNGHHRKNGVLIQTSALAKKTSPPKKLSSPKRSLPPPTLLMKESDVAMVEKKKRGRKSATATVLDSAEMDHSSSPEDETFEFKEIQDMHPTEDSFVCDFEASPSVKDVASAPSKAKKMFRVSESSIGWFGGEYWNSASKQAAKKAARRVFGIIRMDGVEYLRKLVDQHENEHWFVLEGVTPKSSAYKYALTIMESEKSSKDKPKFLYTITPKGPYVPS